MPSYLPVLSVISRTTKANNAAAITKSAHLMLAKCRATSANGFDGSSVEPIPIGLLAVTTSGSIGAVCRSGVPPVGSAEPGWMSGGCFILRDPRNASIGSPAGPRRDARVALVVLFS